MSTKPIKVSTPVAVCCIVATLLIAWGLFYASGARDRRDEAARRGPREVHQQVEKALRSVHETDSDRIRRIDQTLQNMNR